MLTCVSLSLRLESIIWNEHFEIYKSWVESWCELSEKIRNYFLEWYKIFNQNVFEVILQFISFFCSFLYSNNAVDLPVTVHTKE